MKTNKINSLFFSGRRWTFIGVFLLICTISCKEKEQPYDKKELGEEVALVKLKTGVGDMVLWLYPETPLHYDNFLQLAKEGFYNGTIFHRVIPGFMIQGGDPDGNGSGGPGYTIPAEIRPNIRHKRGSLAAARLGDNVNPSKASSGSQFYISVSTQGTSSLNGEYTVFGEVLEGMEVADKIVNMPRNPFNDRPNQPVSMEMEVFTMLKDSVALRYGIAID
jgi:cyclophilin family peptidyl-prolyl cis-trans isomerase